uniref:Uncharacterized protein n=1 Tax=Anopheles atroparvus TaxID=41427 RepID=A0AAG5CU51_ANOAO
DRVTKACTNPRSSTKERFLCTHSYLYCSYSQRASKKFFCQRWCTTARFGDLFQCILDESVRWLLSKTCIE